MSQSTLANIFSTESLTNFSRSFKQIEFEKNNEKILEEKKKALEESNKKKKKPKHKKRDKELLLAQEENNNKAIDNIGESNIDTKDEKVLSEEINKDELTVFLGNIPITETIKTIKKFCSHYGNVESVRLRSVPIAGTKVDDNGNQDLVKKVCVNSHLYGEQKGSLNAYVVFQKVESVNAILEANNTLFVK